MVRKILAALALSLALGVSPVSADEGLVESDATVTELSVEADATVSELSVEAEATVSELSVEAEATSSDALESQLDEDINIAWDAF
jgi:hypothetical protein